MKIKKKQKVFILTPIESLKPYNSYSENCEYGLDQGLIYQVEKAIYVDYIHESFAQIPKVGVLIDGENMTRTVHESEIFIDKKEAERVCELHNKTALQNLYQKIYKNETQIAVLMEWAKGIGYKK